MLRRIIERIGVKGQLTKTVEHVVKVEFDPRDLSGYIFDKDGRKTPFVASDVDFKGAKHVWTEVSRYILAEFTDATARYDEIKDLLYVWE